VSASVRCRHCGCSEEQPCRLRTSDDCLLNVVTEVCNNPACQIALRLAVTAAERERRAELRAAVMPIAEGWRRKRIADREAKVKGKSRKSRNRQRRAA
jgi:hypothetical protein